MSVKGTKFTSTCSNGNTVIYFEYGTANIEDVTIDSKTLGGIYASGSKTYSKTSTGNVKNCKIKVSETRANGYDWLSSALAASHGSTLNVDGESNSDSNSYQGHRAAAYVFSSGGTINLKAGKFEGTTNCLIVDRSQSDLTESTVESHIYYDNSKCSFTGNNATKIASGYTGNIEEKTFSE